MPMTINYDWRGRFTIDEVDLLHAEGFAHPVLEDDWKAHVERYNTMWLR
jgi:hypothetical protein